MDRAWFRNNFSRIRILENKLNYNNERNFYLSLVRKVKRDYYNNVDQKTITDSKLFLNTIKLFFFRPRN